MLSDVAGLDFAAQDKAAGEPSDSKVSALAYSFENVVVRRADHLPPATTLKPV
jgi:hypothetical protein